jgi:hypothetical protein
LKRSSLRSFHQDPSRKRRDPVRDARRYRVDLEPFLELNHLKRTSRVSKGMTLLIPLSKDEEIKRLAMAKKKNGTVQKDTPKKRNQAYDLACRSRLRVCSWCGPSHPNFSVILVS